ncbi:hypothetical protein, partial [Shigella flexneri]|uniref:hypothetical protein n=1 Tax=Shigella flexneri TaxID=623 RepID=UPI001C0A7638
LSVRQKQFPLKLPPVLFFQLFSQPGCINHFSQMNQILLVSCFLLRRFPPPELKQRFFQNITK